MQLVPSKFILGGSLPCGPSADVARALASTLLDGKNVGSQARHRL